MPHLRQKTAFAITLCAAAWTQQGLAQLGPTAILTVDVNNAVRYDEDISDPSKFATVPGPAPASPIRTFTKSVFIYDIVAVNGQPAKGTMIQSSRAVFLRPVPTPGQAIGDTTENTITEWTLEFLNSDGSQIGTIATLGVGGGPPPPGAPLKITQGTGAIVGGTGAFLGARGQFGLSVSTSAARAASMAEDPANRRTNGGGTQQFVLQLIPMVWPQIVTNAGMPAVTHSSDFTLVTASKPAAAGEVLSVFASGLGPTRPGVDPGQPFPASPAAAANSPVQITVNGKPAQAIGAVGFPGAVDGYQINFRVPPDTAKGTATIQLSAAWIAGPAVSIAIQ